MYFALLVFIIVFALVVGAEFLRRTERVSVEVTRKSVHVLVGAFVATWPLFIDYKAIALLGLAFLLVIAISRRLHLFHAIHDVRRNTWGELLYPVAIIITALTVRDGWIFTCAMLHMSVADGSAALAGQHASKAQTYKVFGQRKSIPGTATFFLVSVMIVGLLLSATNYQTDHTLLIVIFVPLLATIAENIAVHGLDNILVPLVVAGTLGLIA